ncbi:MAG TPA: alcohol dehydrogenase catalytic domain-containing protein [Acidimicrobiales bacterium]|nr:alcohol dehydrogenase catalytic domain-containing protein [Acidimicrobiales bacterium]
MSDGVIAAIQTGPRAIELIELPRPRIGADDALLRVEACGICGTDVEQYRGELDGVIDLRYPLVPGHEPVGVIDEIGPDAAARWKLAPGDRVAVEPFVPCGGCRACLTGAYEHCNGWPQMMSYGFISTSVAPGAWGGYATHLYLHPKAVLHRVPPGIAPDLAVLFNPLGAGVRWGVHLPRTTIGSTVLVLGPGQRGLATAIAAKMAGAAIVIVTGLTKDRHKLDLALTLGADAVVDVEQEDLVPRVRELTGGAMADVVVDVTANATRPVVDALDAVRAGGTVVLGGLKGDTVPNFPSDKVVLRGITVIGARGVTAPAYRSALDIIDAGTVPLERLRTHVFPLAEAERAIQVLAGEVPGEHAVNVVIQP